MTGAFPPILIVVLAILAAIVINLLLIATVRTSARRNPGIVITRMLKAAKQPYQQTDEELDQLATMLDQSTQNTNAESAQKT